MVASFATAHCVIGALSGRTRGDDAEADDVGEAVGVVLPVCVVRDLLELVEVDKRYLTRPPISEGDELSEQLLALLQMLDPVVLLVDGLL